METGRNTLKDVGDVVRRQRDDRILLKPIIDVVHIPLERERESNKTSLLRMENSDFFFYKAMSVERKSVR